MNNRKFNVIYPDTMVSRLKIVKGIPILVPSLQIFPQDQARACATLRGLTSSTEIYAELLPSLDRKVAESFLEGGFGIYIYQPDLERVHDLLKEDSLVHCVLDDDKRHNDSLVGRWTWTVRSDTSSIA